MNSQSRTGTPSSRQRTAAMQAWRKAGRLPPLEGSSGNDSPHREYILSRYFLTEHRPLIIRKAAASIASHTPVCYLRVQHIRIKPSKTKLKSLR